VIVGAIMGTPEPVAVELRNVNGMNQPALSHSCEFTGPVGIETADPGVRLQTFVDRFPDRSASATICQDDLSGALDQLGELIVRSIGTACVGASLADFDPDRSGLQVDCIVEDVLGDTATEIDPCGPTPSAPCWRLVTDAATCANGDHLKLEIDRDAPVDPATIQRMQCVLAE
jgi:hypothetical protein